MSNLTGYLKMLTASRTFCVSGLRNDLSLGRYCTAKSWLRVKDSKSPCTFQHPLVLAIKPLLTNSRRYCLIISGLVPDLSKRNLDSFSSDSIPLNVSLSMLCSSCVWNFRFNLDRYK